MTRELGRFDDELPERRRSGAGLGTLLLVAAAGVGLGLLAAPETGVRTRRRLRHRLTALGADLGEGLEGMQFGGRARERAQERLASLRRRAEELEAEIAEDEDEDEPGESNGVGTALAMLAGIAATYFLSSERAAPARTRVRETADTVRRRATDRWERFQRSRGNGINEGVGEGAETADEIRASDKPPLGS